jgi:hypothetical protein
MGLVDSPGEEDERRQSLAPVPRVQVDPLPNPQIGGVGADEANVERRVVVRVRLAVHLEHLVRDRLLGAVVSERERERCARRGHVRRVRISDQTNPVQWRAIERRRCDGIVERILQVGPAAPEDVATFPGSVAGPLPDVPGQVVHPVPAHALIHSDGRRSLAVVAERHDVWAAERVCRCIPVVDGRKRHARVAGVRGCLVPAHTAHG